MRIVKEADMHKKALSFIVVIMFSFFIGGCVTTATYDKKAAEADSQAQQLAAVKADRDQLKEAFAKRPGRERRA